MSATSTNIALGCLILASLIASWGVSWWAMRGWKNAVETFGRHRCPPRQFRPGGPVHGPRAVLISPQGQTQRLPRHVPEQKTVCIDLGSAT